MKSKVLPSLLSIAGSLGLLAPPAMAAGMVVIDPGQLAMPVARPAQPNTAAHKQLSLGLRLDSAEIRVDINEQVAKTYIRQTFVNDSDRTVSGTYLFPLPEDTTFSSFSLHIDGKPVEGKILEANEARQEFENIVRQNANPGLLEYADYKTVRAHLVNIAPHGSRKIELEYTQVLKADGGMIKYSFPLRTEGETAPAKEIKISAKMTSAQGLRTIWSPTHIISSSREGDHKATANYVGKNILPDKDFLLYYSVSDKEMSASLLTQKSSGEDGYFLLTLTPPVKAKEIANKDIVFVADTSLSMFGQRMTQNKKALKYLVNALNPGDRFSLVQFNTDASEFKSKLVPATPDNKKAAFAYIDGLEAQGSTNIGDALKLASSMLGAKDHPSYILLMTDGEPTVGETSIPGLLKVVDAKKDIRVFDFGVGYDVNTKLLNRLAEDNHGTSQYVEPSESLDTAVSRLCDKIKSPVLSNVKISFDGIQVKELYPANVKDIFAGSQVVLLGKYKGSSASASCHINGTINGAQRDYNFPLKFENQTLGHSYLPRLWAMRRIAYLTDLAENSGNRDAINEIVALSKKYGMVTNYTSFLVSTPEQSKLAALPSGHGGGLSAPGSRAMAPSAPSANYKADDYRRDLAKEKAERQEQSHSADGSGGIGSGSVSEADMPADKGFGYGQVGGEISGKTAARNQFIPPSVTGKKAVLRAKQLNELKDSLAVDQEAKPATALEQKTVADKTFFLRNGFWVDSLFDDFKFPKPEQITFGSTEYFDLLKNVPGISKYLSIGRQVILIYERHCYKITYKAS